MRVFILAAGFGTRLRPLTNTCPKALVEVGKRPMLSYTLDLLEKYNVQKALINTHYFAEQVIKFVVQENKNRSLQIEIQNENKLLLGSGGAIAQAKNWLFAKENFCLIWNPDGLIFPNLHKFQLEHEENYRKGALSTLNLLRHPEAGLRYQAVCMSNGKINDFTKKVKNDKRELFHFAGGYFLSKEAVDLLPPAGTVSSIGKHVWIPLMKQQKLAGRIYSGPYQDLGSYSDIPIANERIRNGELAMNDHKI